MEGQSDESAHRAEYSLKGFFPAKMGPLPGLISFGKKIRKMKRGSHSELFA